MLKNYYNSVIILILLFSNFCLASENNYYISFQAGRSFLNSKLDFEPLQKAYLPEITKEKFKPSNIYNFTIGKKVHDSIFLELEVAHDSNYKFGKSTIIDFNDPDLPVLQPELLLPLYHFNTKLKTTSIFISTSYQFKNLSSYMIPYVTAGLGYSRNKIKDTEMISFPPSHYSSLEPYAMPEIAIRGKRTSNLAWQLGGGVLIPLTSYVDINLSYKFRNLGKAYSSANYLLLETKILEKSPAPLFKGKVHSSNFLVGFSLKF